MLPRHGIAGTLLALSMLAATHCAGSGLNEPRSPIYRIAVSGAN